MGALEPIKMKYRVKDLVWPRGWYCVAEASDISTDKMFPVTYLDQQLIVFRNRSGAAQVADAYCPHLGAHLASSDGCIENGNIVCPFHKWAWDSESGRCNSIPYTQTTPPSGVKLTFHPTREVNGQVLMWYCPTGTQPSFEPFENPLLKQDGWLLYHDQTWITTAPYRDMVEQIFDTAHIVQLHRGQEMPDMKGMDRTGYGLSIDYEVNPEMTEYGIKQMKVDITGLQNISQEFIAETWQTIMMHTFTPIDEERFAHRGRLYLKDLGSEEMNEMIGRPWIERFVSEVDQDYAVLNYKKYVPAPVLCRGDGPIMRFREYASPFFV